MKSAHHNTETIVAFICLVSIARATPQASSINLYRQDFSFWDFAIKQ